MTTINTLNTIISLTEQATAKGTRLVKALRTATYKTIGKVEDSEWEKGVTVNTIYLLSTLCFAKTAEEINEVYSIVGRSCMAGKSVGEFYELIDVECATIEGARALVNKEDKTFYKVYGENHFVLESILMMIGYRKSPSWLGEARAERKSALSQVSILKEEDLDGYLAYVRSLEIPGISRLVDDVLLDVAIMGRDGVVEVTPEFIRSQIEWSFIEYDNSDYSYQVYEHKAFSIYNSDLDGVFIPYVDGDL